MQIKNTELKIVCQADVAVAPSEPDGVDEYAVRRVCAAALTRAAAAGEVSIRLPGIGLAGNFPVIASAKIMAQEILKHCRFTATPLREITIALSDEATRKAYEQTVAGYVTHIQDDLGNGPYVTVDAIVEVEDGIVLIERSNPPFGWALPGGFVDVGESLETAVAREVEEETGLRLTGARQFRTYSDPGRDPRFHTVSTVFTGRGLGRPRFGSDAKGLQIVPVDELTDREYAFDHKQVIADYLAWREQQTRGPRLET